MPVTYPSFSLPNPRRRRTYAVLRSLVNVAKVTDTGALDQRSILAGEDEAAGQIVINFPTMPETIELARRANYYNAVRSPITPDGFHVYESTEPLTIPVTFNLSAFDDDYCPAEFGPLILLSIAAKLHALALPIAASPGARTQNLAPVQAAAPVPNGSSEAELKGIRVGTGVYQAPSTGNFYFPPACALQIIMAQVGGGVGQPQASNDGVRSLGINCMGFVSDVRVVFKGPWLQGSFSNDGARNMPSSAEFSFTFVHQPGYTNNVLGSNFSGNKNQSPALITTTARDIYNRLYNTIDISNSVTYAGLLAADTGQQPTIVSPTNG